MLKAELLVFLVMFTLLIFVGNAYAQSSLNIMASTNKASYQPGGKVIITGSIPQVLNGNPVTLIVRNPIGNVYDVGQETLVNNMFVHDFVISEDSQSGVYTVNIKFEGQTTEIQFVVNAGQLQFIPVLNSVINVRGNNTNLIKYGSAEISAVDYSITIPIDTSRMSGVYVIEEYQIPKQVIDAPGYQLIIKEDGKVAECAQTETDVQRIVDCPIQVGTKQLMFIGTVVIPEFGPASGTILTISTMTALILFSRYATNF
jgi:hypothetical protein